MTSSIRRHIGRSTLWETSGHLGFYKEKCVLAIVMKIRIYIKPIQTAPSTSKFTKCDAFLPRPAHPLCQKGTVYRYERSGVLHGLMRVRGFAQDDAHHFCRTGQVPAIDFILTLA